MYMNETIKNAVQTIQKHSKYKYTYYQNTHTLRQIEVQHRFNVGYSTDCLHVR